VTAAQLTTTEAISGTPRWFSFALKMTSGAVSPVEIQFLNPSENFMVSFSEIGGLIELYRGTTLVATGTSPFPYDAWFWVEIEMLCQNAAGVCNVYLALSPTPAATFTGDTQNTATANWNIAGMLGTAAGIWTDDWIVSTTRLAGEVFGYAPDINAQAAAPAPVGTWTPTGAATSWQAVATKPLQTAIYTEDPATAGARIFFEKAALPWSPTSILCAKSSVYSARDGTVTLVEIGVSDAATAYSGTKSMGAAGAFVLNENILETDPDTAAAWTEAGFNAAKVGSRYS
jgi:hypothetical protein